MAWNNVLGHDRVAEAFRRCVLQGRLGAAYLFVGPAGIGKRTFALALAKALLCPRLDAEHLLPCQACDSCGRADAGEHPDLLFIQRPEGKSCVPIELFVGDPEHRLRTGLGHHLSLKPYMSHRRIGIIDDADHLNEEGANCLLKTLEEPPPRSLLILIGTSEHKQLPTIRSRCQVVRFAPLAEEHVAALLPSLGLAAAEDAARLASLSEGSLSRAAALSDGSLSQFRQALWGQLAAGDPPPHLADAVLRFAEEAGKEAALRRERARFAIGCAAEFYAGLMRRDTGGRGDGGTAGAEHSAVARGVPGGPARVAECLEGCLGALEQLDRNAYLPLVVEGWVDELHRVLQRSE